MACIWVIFPRKAKSSGMCLSTLASLESLALPSLQPVSKEDSSVENRPKGWKCREGRQFAFQVWTSCPVQIDPEQPGGSGLLTLPSHMLRFPHKLSGLGCLDCCIAPSDLLCEILLALWRVMKEENPFKSLFMLAW